MDHLCLAISACDPDDLLMGGFDNKFHEEGEEAGIALPGKGRGAVVEDFNNDGMLDILVVNRMQKAFLYRNLGAKTDWGYRPLGNWTEIELDNGPVNHMGIGATIGRDPRCHRAPGLVPASAQHQACARARERPPRRSR